MQLLKKNQISPYIVATIVIVIAVLIRLLLDPYLKSSYLFVTLYGAIAYISWHCGIKPSFFAAVTGYALCNYLFIEPRGSLSFSTNDQIGFFTYLLTSSIIIAMGEWARKTQARYLEKEKERKVIEVELRDSERCMRSILESITDCFFSLDRHWRFKFINPSAERILKRPAKELLNKIIWEEFPELKGSEIEAMYLKVVREHAASTLTSYYAPFEKWFDIRAFPTCEGIAVYFQDVTQRIIAESILRESEEKRRLALDSAELGAWNVELPNQRLTGDERYYLISSGAKDPITYDQAIDFVHPEDRDRIIEAVARATDPNDPIPFVQEFRVIHVDGSIHWVLGKGKPNFRGEGVNRKIVSFDGTVGDITPRKHIEEQILSQSAALAEADQRKNEFIATLAHELRNPLAPIRNSLSIMEHKQYDINTVRKAHAVIENQVIQMVRLVDDLLDVSRISHGKLELKREVIELNSIFENVFEACKHQIEKAGLTLTISSPGEPIYLNADLTRITQVFINILNNAAKFTDPGGKVSVKIERLEETRLGAICPFIKVSVCDTGIGINAENLPKIFEAFVQLPSSSNRSQGGLGIGLMLVKKLVEMHDGKIEVSSEGQGRGTTFTVWLPILEHEIVSLPKHSKNIAKSASKEKIRILIVDDNVAAAESLSDFLEMTENEIRVVNNGIAALEIASNFRPQVIFMDIGLPDINGYEVASRIRTQHWGHSPKIYAITGWGQEEHRFKSNAAGFDAHLVKPVEPEKILELLKV